MIPSIIVPVTSNEIMEALRAIVNDENRIEAFEQKFAEYIGSENVLLTNSGRAALYLLLQSYGLRKGDEVIMPAYGCESVARLIMDMGYRLGFVDVDKDTYNMSIEDLKEKISCNTKAIIAIHMFGNPCKMKDILGISHDYNAVVIEDSAQVIGAEYMGKKVGMIGDSGFFSIGEGKPITTINGGIIVSNNKRIINNCKKIMEKFDALKYKKFLVLAKLITYYMFKNPYFYDLAYKMLLSRRIRRRNESKICTSLNNFKFKYTDMQASVGIIQLSNLKSFNDFRIRNAEFLMKQLNNIEGVHLPQIARHCKPIFLRLPIWLENITQSQRRHLIYIFQKFGIDAPVGYPNSLPQFFLNLRGYPNAEDLVKKTIMLPTHPCVKENDLKRVASILLNFQRLKDSSN